MVSAGSRCIPKLRTSLFVARVIPPKEKESPVPLMEGPPTLKTSILSGFSLNLFDSIHSSTVSRQC